MGTDEMTKTERLQMIATAPGLTSTERFMLVLHTAIDVADLGLDGWSRALDLSADAANAMRSDLEARGWFEMIVDVNDERHGHSVVVCPDPRVDQRLGGHSGAGVYVIGPVDAKSSRYKIGVTGDVARRLAELRRGSAEDLRVYLFAPGEGAEYESALHGRFEPWRIHSEWFDLDDEMFSILYWDVWQRCRPTFSEFGHEDRGAF